jgi:hypothetical protein
MGVMWSRVGWDGYGSRQSFQQIQHVYLNITPMSYPNHEDRQDVIMDLVEQPIVAAL